MSATLETSSLHRSLRGPGTLLDSVPHPGPSRPLRHLPFAAAILLSAFLLFQVQLLLGKHVLPLFGGAPAVWTACLLVFQLLLLAGYAYSHAIAARLSPRQQARAQIFLLILSLIAFLFLARLWPTPITPGLNYRPEATSDPTFDIIKFVLAAIGLPFFLLSTTSPLLQHWFARSAPSLSPYRLYALSNIGSLLGLLSYPVLFEPNLHLRAQAWIWVAGYASYVLVYCICAGTTIRTEPAPNFPASPVGPPKRSPDSLGWSLPLCWVSLAACASTLLLATTNLICQEVAVIPFLWVLPLSLYLLSFILCFESDRWYHRAIFQPLFVAATALVIVVSLPNTNYSYLVQLVAYSALLFSACMVCHGEAARTRPVADLLTGFYLSLSVGGTLGGIFVSIIAPRIFPNYWEFPVGVLACIVLVLNLSMNDRSSWWHTGRVSLALALFAGIVLLLPPTLAPIWSAAAHQPRSLAIGLAAILFAASLAQYFAERAQPALPHNPIWVRAAARAMLAVLTAGLVITQKAEFYNVIARSRNFYGVLSLVENCQEHYLALRHGKTTHGYQYQDPQRALLATGYYGPHSGANAVISDSSTHPLRVGLVGMGVGTLAALAQPGDVFRFYEISPDVYKWSYGQRPYFTYLQNSRGKIEVALGDARLSLQDEAARGLHQNFDLLVLDAFSSDAIPMHLLTREAFTIYQQHLRSPRSVIAIHISNNTLDLRPVLAGIAQEFSFHALHVTPFLPNGPLSQSEWVLLSHDPTALDLPDAKQDSEPLLINGKPILWTDDYCNLLGLLRPRQ